MPTEPTSAATTADAEVVSATTAAGEMPKAGPMSEADARAVFAKSKETARPKIETSGLEELVPGENEDPLADPVIKDPLLEGLDGEPEEEEEGETPAEPAEEVTAEETQEEIDAREAAEKTAEPAEKTEPDGRKRINLNRKKPDGTPVYSAQERAALSLADEEGIGFIEAWTQLYGAMPEKEAPAAKTEPEAKAPTSTEIQTQIAELRAKRKEAAKGLDLEKSSDLTEQIEDLLEQKAKAEKREDAVLFQRQAAATAHEQAQVTSMQEAGKLFPDAVAEGTPLHTALAAEIAKIERNNPSVFNDPEWPEGVTARLAARLGIAPATAKAPVKPVVAAAKPAAKPVAPTKAARPAPAAGGIAAPAPKNDAQELSAKIKAVKSGGTLDQAKSLFREVLARSKAA